MGLCSNYVGVIQDDIECDQATNESEILVETNSDAQPPTDPQLQEQVNLDTFVFGLAVVEVDSVWYGDV